MGKTWLIASGKGGVGKSTLSACIGIGLTMKEHRVCIVDADIGLRDQDVILGMENRIVYDVVDVCNRSCRLESALIPSETHPKLFLLPAAQFARSKELDKAAFAKLIEKLREQFDDVLIDCPAGIERGLRTALQSHADELIVICTPDDVCIRNVERTAALMEKKDGKRPQLIVNRLVPRLIAAKEMYTAQVVAETLDLPLLGEVPEDDAVYRALISHQTAMDVECEAADATMRIVRRMLSEAVPPKAYGTEKLPWYKQLLNKKVKPLKTKGGTKA